MKMYICVKLYFGIQYTKTIRRKMMKKDVKLTSLTKASG